MLEFGSVPEQGKDNQCLATYQDWLLDITWNRCPEASASPLRSIPADGLILKQPLMSQPAEDTSSDELLSDGILQLTHSVSCTAEAISPL
ncbi:hypothetical protein Tco_1546382 [Tanacetum coccineum]